MAPTAETPVNDETLSVSVSQSGGQRYGDMIVGTTREGRLRLTLGDTYSSDDYVGIGLFESLMNEANRARLREIHQLLCRHDSQNNKNGFTMDGPAGYSVTCGGVDKQGSLYRCPPEIGGRVRGLAYELAKSIYATGRKLVKLDMEADVVSQPYNFLVTVRFINSGERAIRFKSPTLWSGQVYGETLGVGGKNPESKGWYDTAHPGGWGFDLAGVALLNAKDYPDEVITVPPGETRELRFLASPDGKYKRGTFDFAAGAWMNIHVEGTEWIGGPHVDFFSGEHTRKRITIDRDYPATPQEWEDYEANHRKKMVSWPVYVNAAFAEDGYYRARAYHANAQVYQYGRFVTRFLKGAKAPDAVDQQADSGQVMGPGPYTWVWEADAASVIDASSKTACPKSGRWFAKIPTDVANASYYLSRDTIVSCTAGQTLPAVGMGDPADEARVRWTWIGP